jgi:hypothetical protein
VALRLPEKLASPKWPKWLQYADVTLQQAVALSIDWDPDEAREADLVPLLYNDRYELATNHAAAGKLRSTRPTQYTLSEFARWANGMGWDLPTKFPKPPPPPSKPPPPKPAAEGTLVTLPRVSRKLNALFAVIRTHWTKYDPKNPPKQASVAEDIDKVLGWTRSQMDRLPGTLRRWPP